MTEINNADSGNKERAPELAAPHDITVTGKHDAVVLPLKVNGVDLPNEVPGISSRYRLECGGIGTLSWAKPTKKPVKYIVMRSVDNQATWVKHTESSGDFQKADIEVEPGVTNFFRVTAWTSDTKKSDSGVISIFRDAPLPAPILNKVYVSLREEPTARPEIYFDWLWPSYNNPQVDNLVHKYFIQTLSASSPSEIELKATDNNNWNLDIADIGGWSDTLGNKEPYDPAKIDYRAYGFPRFVKVIGEGGVVQTRANSIPYATLTPSQAPPRKITAIRVAQVSETNGCVGVFSNYLTVVTPDQPNCGQAVLIGNADAGCCEKGDDYLGCKSRCPVRSLQTDTVEAQFYIKEMAKLTARAPILDGYQTLDPREYLRYVFNNSYNVIYYDSLFPNFSFTVLDGNNIPVAFPNPAEKNLCGAFVCFKYVPTQTEDSYTGKDIANVLYAEPILFLPKSHKFTISAQMPIKMAINFTLSSSADLKYIQNSLPLGSHTPEIPYKITLKIVDKNGDNAQPLKFYNAPGPRELGQPTIYNNTTSQIFLGCYSFTRIKFFDQLFKPTGTPLILYEDAFPSSNYILGYDALGQPVANVRATFEANVNGSNVDNIGPCGIWLKCLGFDMRGDCKGAYATVESTIETPQPTGLIIQPDLFPELGPRYLIIEYKPENSVISASGEPDGITFDYRRTDIQKRGPMAVAPNSPGDIGSLGIWVGDKVLRRMGNADGTELRVVIPITTQTGAVALNYTDIPGLYWDNAGKWHFEVLFGRDCVRSPLKIFPTPPPQPPTEI